MNLSNFSDYTRVVIVDDKTDEGSAIKRALESINIPSVFLHVTSNRALPKEPFKNIRLVFLDLIFNDSGAQTVPAQNASNALSKLSKIVDKEAFYILVLWSAHTSDEVATKFHEHMNRQLDFARPYKTLTLLKTDYRKTNGSFDAKKIIREINKQLATIPSMRIFSDWEKLTTDTVSTVAGEVAGQKSHENLSKVINSLAMAYGGKGNKKDIPQNALMALNEIFKTRVSEKVTSNRFGNLYKKISDGDLDSLDKAKLNTSLMFSPDVDIEGPGSIYKLKQAGKGKDTIVSSIIIESKTAIGRDYSKIIPIAVDITPLCNAAQKNGVHRYFLQGVLYPENFTNVSGNQRPINISSKMIHSYSLDKGFWNEEKNSVYRMSFNLKLFHTSKAKGYESMYMKLRDNLVIDLQHKVAGYVSRPGHTLL